MFAGSVPLALCGVEPRQSKAEPGVVKPGGDSNPIPGNCTPASASPLVQPRQKPVRTAVV